MFIREFVSGEHPEEKLLAASISPLEEFMKVASSEASLHAQLKTKYERAARRPWIAVSPDDDAPEVDLMELYLKCHGEVGIDCSEARPSSPAARPRNGRARACSQEVM